ncbi:MAG: hypothetical protein AVDCRST_MAG18-5190, partial [uncultured Thermomicrobiales bacterium]
ARVLAGIGAARGGVRPPGRRGVLVPLAPARNGAAAHDGGGQQRRRGELRSEGGHGAGGGRPRHRGDHRAGGDLQTCRDPGRRADRAQDRESPDEFSRRQGRRQRRLAGDPDPDRRRGDRVDRGARGASRHHGRADRHRALPAPRRDGGADHRSRQRHQPSQRGAADHRQRDARPRRAPRADRSVEI